MFEIKLRNKRFNTKVDIFMIPLQFEESNQTCFFITSFSKLSIPKYLGI